MIKQLGALACATTLLCSPVIQADGSGTASEGSAMVASGSVMVLAGGASIITEIAEASGTMVVHSVEVAGDVIILTLSATAASAELVVIHLSAATAIASSLVAGAVVTASAVTSSAIGGTSFVIGHLLVHAGEVLMFIPHHDLAIGLHSHVM